MGFDSVLDEAIGRARAAWGNVGVAVTVVRAGQIAYTYAAGPRRLGDARPIDSHTLFQIGSLTKAFTAAAVAILVHEKGIGFDTPAADILPGLDLGDPWISRHVTLRDLISHRAGLSVNIYPYLAPFSPARALEQLKHLRAASPFRDCFQYDNLMYALLGRLVEVLGGASWHDIIARRIFAPLEMRRSGTSATDYWPPGACTPCFLGTESSVIPGLDAARDANIAMPHGWDGAGRVVPLAWQDYNNTAAAGAIVSSASDLTNWLIMHMSGGVYGGRQVIPPDVFGELHAPQNLRTAAHQFQFLDGDRTYAMGWERARHRSHRHLAHGGGILGFPAYAAMLPERGVGVVILSNGPKAAASDYTVEQLFHKAIAMEVFDADLGVRDRDWVKAFADLAAHRTAASRDADAKLDADSPTAPPLPSDAYVGTYRDRVGNSGDVIVECADASLRLRFDGEGAYTALLRPSDGHTFRLGQSPTVESVLGAQFVTFRADGGCVAGLTAFGPYGGFFERTAP